MANNFGEFGLGAIAFQPNALRQTSGDERRFGVNPHSVSAAAIASSAPSMSR